MTQSSRNSPIWYRGYRIYFDPPPIPIHTMDWQFVHDDYDGGSKEPFGPPMIALGHVHRSKIANSRSMNWKRIEKERADVCRG